MVVDKEEEAGGGGGGGGAGGIQNQKQEPHTKMWGKREREDRIEQNSVAWDPQSPIHQKKVVKFTKQHQKRRSLRTQAPHKPRKGFLQKKEISDFRMVRVLSYEPKHLFLDGFTRKLTKRPPRNSPRPRGRPFCRPRDLCVGWSSRCSAPPGSPSLVLQVVTVLTLGKFG